MSNIFELASRKSLRFSTIRGLVTVEQLWTMPLKAVNQFCLNTVAQNIDAQLETADKKDFVETAEDPAKEELQLQMAIVKHIISVRLEENKQKSLQAANKAEIERLTGILHNKKDAALNELSIEELTARLELLKK